MGWLAALAWLGLAGWLAGWLAEFGWLADRGYKIQISFPRRKKLEFVLSDHSWCCLMDCHRISSLLLLISFHAIQGFRTVEVGRPFGASGDEVLPLNKPAIDPRGLPFQQTVSADFIYPKCRELQTYATRSCESKWNTAASSLQSIRKQNLMSEESHLRAASNSVSGRCSTSITPRTTPCGNTRTLSTMCAR